MLTSPNELPKFSRWRNALWPVHRFELKKLVPMLFIFFLVSFDYSLLRIMKDTLVVTAKSSGAEVIPFIKVWVMFPGALLMTFLFTRLSNRLSREKVFYVMMGGFLAYFFLFTAFLYPAREQLHPHAAADALSLLLPPGFKGMIAMFRNWTLTTFYVMSELWSNIILTLLFWGFANQITRLGEAKRFYGLFGIGANLSGVAAGWASASLSKQAFNPHLPFGTDAWGQSMTMLIGLVIIAGIASLLLFRWLNTSVLTDPRFYDPEDGKKAGSVIGKLSMRRSLAYIFSSRYMICIALIVLSYNVVINLVEVVWKHEMRELYPSPSDYNIYMSHVTLITGAIATLTALFISGNSIRKCGWTFTALLTPVVLLITCIGFFAFFFASGETGNMIASFFGATPLVMVVFFGSVQNILSRSAKYSVFDATKEMAFVPLSPENQLKGKPIIDGICSRLGKSGGSVVHQGLLLTFVTITASAPYVAAFLFVVIGIWIAATRTLGKQFVQLTTPGVKPAEVEANPPAGSSEPVLVS
ncbi:MAG: Npt1/Npt2 family nucleotide transporter [Parachlamydiaceae bacterium]